MMNRWIAALAMGLATAANAPAAPPTVDAHSVISSAQAAPDIISSAQAAPSGEGSRLEPAGLVFDRSRASLTTDDGENSLAASGPDPIVAWLLAAGFLGVIVTRRTRAARQY